VNPDLEGMPRQAALTPAAAKAAIAAGVKQAAIVNYEKYVTHPLVPGPVKPVKAAKKAPSKRVLKRAAHKAHRTKGKAAASAAAAKNHPAPAQASAARAVAAPVKPPVATTTAQKKPSAAIPKETAHN